MATTKRVPICTASAPSINAAQNPLASAIPPAATTGIETASATCGTSVIVVCSPICPPDSIPSAITISAPALSISFASATDATTGITLIPASFHIFMYFPGFPAPVDTTDTFSSTTTCATSSICSLKSIIFTPTGLSVISLAFLISLLTHSPGALAAPMNPIPPALLTLAARFALATHAIPP